MYLRCDLLFLLLDDNVCFVGVKEILYVVSFIEVIEVWVYLGFF